jgi:glycosyltransferase involved in cell wall biosynthesis
MGRVALAFLFGACCIHCLAWLPAWHGAIGLLVAAAALALVGRFKLVAALLAGLAWTWLSAAARTAGDLPSALEGQDLVVRGYVASLPQPAAGDSQFLLDVAEPRGGVPPRIRLVWYRAARAPGAGELWQLVVRLKRRNGFANPGGADHEAHLFRDGIGATLIPNGAPTATPTRTRLTLRRFDLEPRRYVLCVARLVTEKRQQDLIAAFQAARPSGWKLVIVGEIEQGDGYCQELIAQAARDTSIVLTGYQRGVALQELYTHAGLFVLPSAVEGHPIALLEAAVYEVPLLASAIPANLALPLPRNRYFPVGDTQALARQIEVMTNGSSASTAERRALHAAVRANYSWRKAAELTSSVYRFVAREGWQHG